MLKETDIFFSRTSEGQVGNFKAFCSPILNGDFVKVIVSIFGGDDDLGSSYTAIAPGKPHDALRLG